MAEQLLSEFGNFYSRLPTLRPSTFENRFLSQGKLLLIDIDTPSRHVYL